MAKQIVNKDGIEIPKGTMEDFKRPSHPDFMSTKEIADSKFTGLRHNAIMDTAELWIMGNLEATVTAEQVKLNPLAINQAYERVFGLYEIMPDTPDARTYVAIRNAMRGD